MYHSAGLIYINGVQVSSSAATWTTNDVIGTAFDRDLGTISFYKNGSLIYSGTSLTNGNSYFELFSDSTDVLVANFGQRPWAYDAPFGFLPLCTTNLPTPTIKKPSSYMDVVTYTGDGTSSRAITGLNFQPELIWIKNRTNAYNHTVVDSVRGGSLYLETNNTNADQSATVISSFNSNGFQIGTSSIQVNGTSNTYVAWAWDEAPIAGMDIVGYVGDGVAGKTVAHSLGVAPKMIIVKNRTTAGFDFVVYHQNMNASPQGGYVSLNATTAYTANTAIWNNTAPSSTVFTIGTNTAVNKSSDNHIAYLFAEVEGFSKFGSYTGNGSADGPFVWCGFRPRWVMVKQTNTTTSNSNWFILDSARNTFNTTDAFVHANTSNAEYGASVISDFLSNGFKLRIADSLEQLNTSTKTYIFAAFAESPFKYARAR